MTANTEKHTETDICKNCRCFREFDVATDEGLEFWGVCRNLNSDHRGHVLSWDHNACEACEQK
jgi:hypothetical protein